jgi:hypothetical protein
LPLDLLTREERHAYNPDKHYLGTLCGRGHDAGNGQSWRHKGHDNCVECTRHGAREWKKRFPERARESTRRRDKAHGKRVNRKTHPIACHVGNAKGRANASGIPCNLSTDHAKLLWRQQQGRCFWTGRDIDFYVGGDRHPLRPSLDRIRPEKGYTPGNVVWASNFANRARGDLDAREFAALMESMGFPSVSVPYDDTSDEVSPRVG